MNSALPKLHFEALDRWLTQQQPSGKTVISALMLFRGCAITQQLLHEEGFFSEVICAVCSWDSENCSHGNNVFVMAEKEKRGERKKEINWHLKGEKEVPVPAELS